MKSHWIPAIFACAVLVTGCRGSGTNSSESAPPANQGTAQAAVGDTAPGVAEPGAIAPADSGALPPAAEPSAPTAAAAAPAAPAMRSAAPPAPAPAPAPVPRAELAPAPAPSVPVAPVSRAREITIPANTTLSLEMQTTLSSETAEVEAPVRARLRKAVSADGLAVIPAGTIFTGAVTDVARAGRVQGRSRLAFRFTRATIRGASENIRTNPIVLEGDTTKKADATKIGAGAGIGAVLGGILGGGKGAAKGAAIGGAAGTGTVLATRGQDVEIASGAAVTATTVSAVTLTVNTR